MSTETTTPPSDVDSLIEEFKQAQRDRRTARNWMTFLLSCVVIIFVVLVYFALQHFQEKDLAIFQEELGDGATELLPVIREQVNLSANRVYPVYQQALVDVYERDEEKYIEVLVEEYPKLKETAEQQWPKIREAVAEAAVELEISTRKELARVIEEERLELVMASYDREFSRYLEFYFEKFYGANMIIAEDMFAKIETIAEQEKDSLPEVDINNPLQRQYIIGMLVELLGMEMQLNAESLME